MLYRPSPSLTTLRTFSIRAGLAASTVTPGSTAPDVSFTTHAIPLACCAHAAGANSTPPLKATKLMPARFLRLTHDSQLDRIGVNARVALNEVQVRIGSTETRLVFSAPRASRAALFHRADPLPATFACPPEPSFHAPTRTRCRCRCHLPFKLLGPFQGRSG